MAHLVPVELFTRQLRSVMRPLSTICSLLGQEWRQREGWERRGEERKDGRRKQEVEDGESEGHRGREGEDMVGVIDDGRSTGGGRVRKDECNR